MSRSSIAGFDIQMSVDMALARQREWDLRRKLDEALRERDEALSKLDDETRKDLDETRRLLYAALAAGRTKKYTLVGTLVNALVHHSGLKSDPAKAIDILASVVEDGTGAHSGHDWVREILTEINERLAETPPVES